MALLAQLGWRNFSKLPSLSLAHPGEPLPDHVVVIPARNEARRIARTVRSFPGSLVVVVDGQSADRTVEVATSAGAHVRTAEPMPEGWTGRANACWTGALYTDSDWILFAGADTWYDSAFLPALLEYAVKEKLVAVSVLPAQSGGSVLASVLAPYAMGVYLAGLDPVAVNTSTVPDAVANGQCLLVRREAYIFVQGHRAVATNQVDDLALARLFKRHRMPFRLVRSDARSQARMHAALASTWRGFELNCAKFFKINRKAKFRSIAAVLAMSLWMPILALLIAKGHAHAAAAFALVPSAVLRRWYSSAVPALLAPVAIYLFLLIAATALFKDLFGIRQTDDRWTA